MTVCFFSEDESANLFPQTLQGYGFSPVWLLMWPRKEQLCLKRFPQRSQEYGFAPVCVLMWTNETFPACLTSVRLLSRVDPVVLLHVRLKLEGLPTYVTGHRLFNSSLL